MSPELSARRWARFRQLTEQVRAEGLLETRPGWYVAHLALWGLIHVALLAVVISGRSPWLSLVALALDAPVVLRISLIIHDLGHGAGGPGRMMRHHIPAVFWPSFVGFSHDFWRSFHSRHHFFNNVATRGSGDPTTDYAPFVMGAPQMGGEAPAGGLAAGLSRWLVRHQGALYWLCTPVLALGLIKNNFAEALGRVADPHRRDGWAVASLGLLFAGHGIHLAAPFIGHGGAVAVGLAVFRILSHTGWIKVSLSLNHIGMPTFAGGEGLDPLTHTALTTRNFKGSGAWLFCWVLSRQIEHHLWPRVAAPYLPRAAELTRAAFEAEGLPYVETELYRAFRHAAGELSRLGALAAQGGGGTEERAHPMMMAYGGADGG